VNKTYRAVEIELTEISELRSKLRRQNRVYIGSLLGLNAAVGVFTPLPFDTLVVLGIGSLAAVALWIILTKVHDEIERMSIQNIALQEEILRLQEIVVSYVVDEKDQIAAQKIAASPFR
jgi:hypothetical protein